MTIIKWSNRGEELQVIARYTTGLKVNKFLQANSKQIYKLAYLHTCILT